MPTNIVTVGLFDKIEKLPEFAKILNLKSLCCSSEYLLPIIDLQNQGKISLELIISFDSITPDLTQSFAKIGIRLIQFEDLSQGDSKNEEMKIDINDPYCLGITSGTTGSEKYCIISHLNLMSTLSAGLYLSTEVSTEDSYLSYLNFSLIGEKFFLYMISASAGKIGLARSSINFKSDIRYLKPTFIIAIPRFLDFLYENIKKEVEGLTGMSKSLYVKAYSSKLKQYEKTGNLKHKVWDAIVFKKARKLMGGKLKVMVIGSGMANKDTIRYLRIVLGCYILEGYGLTEATSCSLCTLPYDTGCGYVGGPIMSIDLKLNYTDVILEDNTHYYGELCIKGNSVSGKYYGTTGNCLDSSG